jgi:Predicted membrane protein (DUF2306)
MAFPERKEDDKGSAATLRWATRALVSIVWISAAIFGLYIIAFYAGVAFDGAIDQWNAALPRLYEPDTPFATIGIGAHFAAGAIVLVLGPIQLIGAVRARAPWLHRWTGRVYVVAALASGLGGLAFIAVKGTIGGAWMNVGFSLYGALVVVAAVATIWRARQRRFAEHRAWAIRLFALAIGSWLYRMDYGFWRMIANGAGHTATFDGPFDVVMAFFFFLPNLIVAEIFIRAPQLLWSRPVARLGAALAFCGASAFLALGTYYFTAYYWGPQIMKRVLAVLS